MEVRNIIHGFTIEDVVDFAIDCANRFGEEVKFDFNDVELVAKPGDCADKIIKYFDYEFCSQMTRNHKKQ